jgi:hypothetical protein
MITGLNSGMRIYFTACMAICPGRNARITAKERIKMIPRANYIMLDLSGRSFMFGADTLEMPCCDNPYPVLSGLRQIEGGIVSEAIGRYSCQIEGNIVSEAIGCCSCHTIYGIIRWVKPLRTDIG